MTPYSSPVNMAGTVAFLGAFWFCYILALSHIPCILSNSNGFSLKLIHRDSLESPFYAGKLTILEKFRRDLEISKSRASDLMLMRKIRIGNATSFPDTIRPLLTRRVALYTVDIDLGTPPRKGTFIFDTGSWLTWSQCKPCINCFKQKYPIFDPRTSRSFKTLPLNHNLSKWFKRTTEGCGYYVQYLTGQSSRGIGCMETFTFQSNTRAPESIRDIVFGCGFDNRGTLSADNSISGLLGMDRTPTSLVRQLGSRIMPRFSYCLPPIDSSFKTTFLRFGNDSVIKGVQVQTAQFLRGTGYILNLTGISIAGQRLRLPWGSFRRGCFVDSGSSLSVIEQKAYSVILNAFRTHFARFKNLTRVTNLPRDLCYKYPRGFKSFPSMTFHFHGGANHEVGMTAVFRFLEKNTFCLELMGHPFTTILGAYQQQNVRFIYDLGNAKLSFVREDCTKDRA
ncbi:unnamed protein product [Ilex paraguariensis]|uniref:Peptidase A1 domain-containing protein n=1 Tax=Ilex paraguariensis TaxID=185542 RepID=A0ABC8U7F8_9AQUA